MSTREKVLLVLVIALVAVVAIGGTLFVARGGNQSKADQPAANVPAQQNNQGNSQANTNQTSTVKRELIVKHGMNLKTLPFFLSPNDGTSVFGSNLSVYYVADGCEQTDYAKCTMLPLNGSKTVSPGMGFWVKSESGETYDIPVNDREVSTRSSYTITLKKGWNTIGNPFNDSISWSPILRNSQGEEATYLKADEGKLILTQKYDPVSRQYKKVTPGQTIEPYEGLLVKVAGDDIDLIISSN